MQNFEKHEEKKDKDLTKSCVTFKKKDSKKIEEKVFPMPVSEEKESWEKKPSQEKMPEQKEDQPRLPASKAPETFRKHKKNSMSINPPKKNESKDWLLTDQFQAQQFQHPNENEDMVVFYNKSAVHIPDFGRPPKTADNTKKTSLDYKKLSFLD